MNEFRRQAILSSSRRAVGLLVSAQKTMAMARQESHLAPRKDWLQDSARLHATAAAEIAAAIGFIRDLL